MTSQLDKLMEDVFATGKGMMKVSREDMIALAQEEIFGNPEEEGSENEVEEEEHETTPEEKVAALREIWMMMRDLSYDARDRVLDWIFE